ncbi:MAG: acyltransferase family protein [Pseudomonas sp.]|nr:acyltransferase family protein [Pseudomonas sp.]
MARAVNGNLDVLKMVLAIIVVVGHSKFLGGNTTTIGYLLSAGLLRAAVPVFFIINGYFMARAMSSGPSMRQWLVRVLWLYLFWMLVYSPFYVDDFSLATLVGVIKKLIIGYFHLWYLVGMIGGGVLVYLLRQQSSRVILTLALTCFGIGLVMQYMRVYVVVPNEFAQHWLEQDYTARNFLFMGFPFVAIGYLMARHDIPQKVSRAQVWCFLIVGLLVLELESWRNMHHQVNLDLNFDFLFGIILVAPAVFLLPFCYPRPSQNRWLGTLSSAVYFVHPLFLFGLTAMGMPFGNLLAISVLALALVVSPLIILAGRRFPFIL